MAGKEVEVWRVPGEIPMGGPSQGPETASPIDPFYECMDCPKYVDFTQPDSLREEDVEAWFEVYVDREVGKPRSYPFFRDPAMDVALCELEVERLLKASHSKSIRPLQTPSMQNVTPPRQRPISGGSSSSADSPPGSCSPNSVLRPSSYRRKPKPSGATSLSRSLDFGTKRHVLKPLTQSIELRPAPSMGAPVWEASGIADVSGASDLTKPPQTADVSRAMKSKSSDVGQVFKSRPADVSRVAESRLADISQLSVSRSADVSQVSKPKRTGVRNPSSRNILSETPLSKTPLAERRASEPRSAPTCKRYMLPTATSIRKQDHKPLRPSADGPGGSSSAQKPMWQAPSLVVRRTSPRHPAGQSSGRSGASSKSPGEVAELRRAVYLQKLGEERRAKLRAEVHRRGPVGALWCQQPGGLGPLPGGKTQERFDAHPQAPLVLAL